MNTWTDLEPNYTYRGHLGPVLSLSVADDCFFSGDALGKIVSWKFPNFNSPSFSDQYAPYDDSLQSKYTLEHNDAVWALALLSSSNSERQLLASASADETIKIWDLNRTTVSQTIRCQSKFFKFLLI